MKTQFETDLKNTVDEFFYTKKKRGGTYLVLKSLILISAISITYGFIIYTELLFLYGILGVLNASIGMNISHDASHGSWSNKQSLNKQMAKSFDICGISSIFWNIQHNLLHHTYVNDVDDPDIQQDPFLRLSPNQPRKNWHRYQHLYAVPLYAFSYISWSLVNDFRTYFRGKMGPIIIKMNVGDHIWFWVGKIIHLTIFIVVPLVFLPVWKALLGYLIFATVCGLVTSIVFQLAHAVPTSAFVQESNKTIRQIQESTDFAPTSKILNWLTGGLNNQTTHHLCTNISHEHYPDLSVHIKYLCEKHRITYNALSLWNVFRSHFMHLRELGKQ